MLPARISKSARTAAAKSTFSSRHRPFNSRAQAGTSPTTPQKNPAPTPTKTTSPQPNPKTHPRIPAQKNRQRKIQPRKIRERKRGRRRNRRKRNNFKRDIGGYTR